MAVQIISGVIPESHRIALYGQEGVGKSQLASQFPKPLFIDFGGSTGRLNVNRVKPPTTWLDTEATIRSLMADPPAGYETLVFDECDTMMRFIQEHVVKHHPAKEGVAAVSIESFGWGKGYSIVAEYTAKLLDMLNALQEKTGWHIVLIFHASLGRVDLPEEDGSYDRWEPNIERRPNRGENAQGLIKAWAHSIYFAAFSTILAPTETKGRMKATAEKRVLRTTRSAAWDAKNRDGLKPELPLDFASIAHLFRTSKQTAQAPTPQVQPTVPAPEPAPGPAPVAPPAPVPTPEPKPAASPPAIGTVDSVEQAISELDALLNTEGLTRADVQRVAFMRNRYPANTPVENYSLNTFRNWLFPNWTAVSKLAKESRNAT